MPTFFPTSYPTSLLPSGCFAKQRVALENWVNVPTNSILTIHRQTVMMHPILDKYYERDPYHVRSSAFVQAKGLASNEKAPTSGSLSPSVETGSGKLHGPANGSIRGLSPDVVRRSLLSPSLLREVAAVPPPGSSPNTTSSFPLRLSPAKGNIKVKRTSVNQIDEFPTGNDPSTAHEEALSHSRNPINAGARGPQRATQFFNELPLGAEAS